MIGLGWVAKMTGWVEFYKLNPYSCPTWRGCSLGGFVLEVVLFYLVAREGYDLGGYVREVVCI